ncbi:hypothetical protein WJX77_009892 [Trebouxia sp. C0004]
MQSSKWAGASPDLLKQVFRCLPRSSRSPYSCRPIIQFANIGSQAPARSTVSRLVTDEVTSDQLQATLSDCHELQSLELSNYMNAVSARGLAGLTHIQSMHLHVNSCASLQSVFTLTHLENLELSYCMYWEEPLPHLPCSDFPHLAHMRLTLLLYLS